MNIADAKSKKTLFNEFDSVQLKEDVHGEDGPKGIKLKKGEIGAIVDIHRNQNETVYEVDFPKKRQTVPVPESKLKAAFDFKY